ncbi:MAG: NfeD family protein [Gammaproteobacteria bacterium]|nr:NfeD family protein [Gammaproteobacteria bacterium]MDH5303666.1 NfeD family protein [Gammaproteobacteria bacterium]MDH5323133.1 NfeD family protein [Gammaproteobacteria bacterium]
MTWWSWMILGAVLLGVEMFAVDAQFYLMFLGVSAALVGLSVLFGVAIPEWGQWLTFAVLALFFFFTFRRTLYLKIRGGGENFPESMSGESITVAEDLEPGREIRSQYRGSDWTVRNVGEARIGGGTRARIVDVVGLTLHVTAE